MNEHGAGAPVATPREAAGRPHLIWKLRAVEAGDQGWEDVSPTARLEDANMQHEWNRATGMHFFRLQRIVPTLRVRRRWAGWPRSATTRC
jgi:hypothetical protein